MELTPAMTLALVTLTVTVAALVASVVHIMRYVRSHLDAVDRFANYLNGDSSPLHTAVAMQPRYRGDARSADAEVPGPQSRHT